MTGWLIYRTKDIERNKRFIMWMLEAANMYELPLDLVPYESIEAAVTEHDCFYSPEASGAPSFIINRSCTPWLNEAAELSNIPVFNHSGVARIANDKRLSHAFMSRLGVPMLPSKALTKDRLVEVGSNSYPFIVKDPTGRGGTGVEWIESMRHLHRTSDRLHDELLWQPVGGKPGKDLRVYIVGGQIIAGILRESETSFRANVSLGGQARLYELNEEEKVLINKITASLPLDFVGLDFLIKEDGGLLFNEMEDAVGCRSLYMNSDIDVISIFMRHVAEELS
ncbi:hypothetical protein FLK61_34930 [Paenalkalicoccus suaedae]|uniref:ATP-grasp domain-containing protein n=1 Tax=Paenalkalicoccus suaedae TaxID=2592382 RepID=A0A859FGT4_9BACI|nr:hypothetical protein [Paenalkalicoccus suaedae]QKS71864.1 hypothetical protein FLK61_34930 [Paenalkalicoccus suaedae]